MFISLSRLGAMVTELLTEPHKKWPLDSCRSSTRLWPVRLRRIHRVCGTFS